MKCEFDDEILFSCCCCVSVIVDDEFEIGWKLKQSEDNWILGVDTPAFSLVGKKFDVLLCGFELLAVIYVVLKLP